MRVIGKIPGLPEFVSQRSFGPPFESLEMWLETGIGYCHVERRSLFDTHFDHAIPHSFVWQPYGQAPVAGIAFPSGDSVGRRFPLVIASDLVVPAFTAQLAPVALGDFLEDIFLMSDDIRTLADRTRIAERANKVRMPVMENFFAARREYSAWAEGTPQREAWARLVDGDVPEKTGPIMAAAVIESLRQKGIVRVPLGRSAAGGASFWIQVVEQTLGVPRAVFWAIDGSSILISQHQPTPPCLAALFLPVPDVEIEAPKNESDVEIASAPAIEAAQAASEEDAPVSTLMKKLSGDASPS